MRQKFLITGLIVLFLAGSLALYGCAPPAYDEPVAGAPMRVRDLRVSDSLTVGNDITVTDDLTVGGDISVSGATSYGGTLAFTSAVSVAATPAATATPQLLISDVGAGNPLEVRNSSATPVARIDNAYELWLSGGLEVDGLADLDGSVDIDVTTFALDSSGGFSIDDSAVASNVSVAGAGIDLTLSSAAGRVVIQASEAAADAVFIDANANATAGLDIDVGATTGVTIDGGMLNVGGGSCSVADGDNDVCIAAVLEVDGELELDGALDADSTADFAGTVAFNADITVVSDATGGNLGAKTELIGLPRIKLLGLGGGTNPGSQTIALFDDTPDGEFAPVTGTVVESLSTTVVKYGTNSYKMAWDASAVATDGVIDAALGANAAWDDMESFGVLVQSDTAWASGDLTLVLTDDGGARTYDIPAITETGKWVWLEVDISVGDLSSISDVAILMSAAGEAALGAFNMYIDIAYVWDSADEETLSLALQQDGVLGIVDPADGTNLVELTDYIVHYESGSDFIVWISDQSAAFPMALLAY